MLHHARQTSSAEQGRLRPSRDALGRAAGRTMRGQPHVTSSSGLASVGVRVGAASLCLVSLRQRGLERRGMEVFRDSSGGANAVRQIEVGVVTMRYVGNELLERSGALAALDDSLAGVAASARGRLALVGGSPGRGRRRSFDGSATAGARRVWPGVPATPCSRRGPSGRFSTSPRSSAGSWSGLREWRQAV